MTSKDWSRFWTNMVLFLATGKWYVRLKHFVCNKVKIGLTEWKKKQQQQQQQQKLPQQQKNNSLIIKRH